MLAWLSTLFRAISGGGAAVNETHREDGFCRPSRTLLGGCRWRACLVWSLCSEANTPQRLIGAFSFVIPSWLRRRCVVARCCLRLRCVVVADTLSLRAQARHVFGLTHASVDAPHSLTHSLTRSLMLTYSLTHSRIGFGSFQFG